MNEREWLFYQAGQAVARCLVNRPFVRVIASSGLIGTEEDGFEFRNAGVEVVRREDTCRVAGYAAVLLLTGRQARADEVAGYDKDWASEGKPRIQSNLARGGFDLALYLESVIESAVLTLLERWVAVESVAAALREREELTRSDVWDILRLNPPPPESLQ